MTDETTQPVTPPQPKRKPLVTSALTFIPEKSILPIIALAGTATATMTSLEAGKEIGKADAELTALHASAVKDGSVGTKAAIDAEVAATSKLLKAQKEAPWMAAPGLLIAGAGSIGVLAFADKERKKQEARTAGTTPDGETPLPAQGRA